MRQFTGCIILAALLAGCDSATDPAADAGTVDARARTVASLGIADPNVSVRLTFDEPVIPELKRSDCPVAPEGFCGSGEVIPFGNATETIEFGVACGGACDLRTIQLPQGSITLQETFSDPACPGFCHPNRAEPVSGILTDVVAEGTGLFEGATGVLTGTVKAAGPESVAKLSGTIAFAP